MNKLKSRVWVTFNNSGNSCLGRMFQVKQLILSPLMIYAEDSPTNFETFLVRADLHGEYFLMLYIGLKDKTGKEIYAGDIIEYGYDFDRKTKGYAIVDLDEMWCGCLCLQYDEYSNGNVNFDTIKVIGNKYENPELITKYRLN